jgi:hypothetical protein
LVGSHETVYAFTDRVVVSDHVDAGGDRYGDIPEEAGSANASVLWLQRLHVVQAPVAMIAYSIGYVNRESIDASPLKGRNRALEGTLNR